MRVIELFDGYAPEVTAAVAFNIHRIYGGPLTGQQRTMTYRDRRRDDAVTDRYAPSQPVTDRHDPHISTTPVVPNGSTPEETASKTKAGARKKQETELPGFTAFWKLYPKKVGYGAAAKEWRDRGCEAMADSVLDALRSQLAHLTRENGKWIPNPSTWLHQLRWKDDPPPVDRNNTSARTSGNAAAAEEAIRFMRERSREQT